MKQLTNAPEHIIDIFTNKSISNIKKEEIFRKALIDYPDNKIGILYLLSLIKDVFAEHEECIKFLEQILPFLDDKEEISTVCFFLGQRYLLLNKEDKAIAHFSKSLEADRCMLAGIELYVIYNSKSDWVNVIKTLNGFECTEKEDMLENLNHKAFAYYKMKKFENAIDCYTTYLDIEPENVEVIANLGALYGELGRTEDSLRLLVKSLMIDPNNADTYFSLGIIYNLMNDYYMSMHYYQEAIKLNPDFTKAYVNMGTITVIEGETEKGLEYLLKALELPNVDNNILCVLYENLMQVYYKLENIEKAIYYMNKADSVKGVAE